MSWYMEKIEKWASLLHLASHIDFEIKLYSILCLSKKHPTLLVRLITLGFADFFFLFKPQAFVSFYPAKVRLLQKSCWTLFFYRLHIFFFSHGFYPKPILFILPAAALELTSVQIYTLYHGWHVVCVSVYLKPSSNCFLLIICDFFLQSSTGW